MTLMLVAVVAFAVGGRSTPAAAACGHDHHQKTDAHGHDAHEARAASADHKMPMTAMHGGEVTRVDDMVFETSLTADGVRVYAYGTDGVPVDFESAIGSATLMLADGESREVELASRTPDEDEPSLYYCPMHPDVVQREPGKCEACGGMTLFQQNLLFGAVQLPESPPDAVEAAIRVDDLPGMDDAVTFSARLAMASDHHRAGGD
jgi:hypothetical protein